MQFAAVEFELNSLLNLSKIQYNPNKCCPPPKFLLLCNLYITDTHCNLHLHLHVINIIKYLILALSATQYFPICIWDCNCMHHISDTWLVVSTTSSSPSMLWILLYICHMPCNYTVLVASIGTQYWPTLYNILIVEMGYIRYL